MGEFKRKYSLRILLVVSNVVMVVIPILLIGWIAVSVNDNIMKRSTSNTVDILFRQINSRIEEYFDSVSSFTQTVFYDKNLQILLQNRENGWLEYYQIQSAFDSYQEVNPSVKGIQFMSYSGHVYNSTSVNYAYEPWETIPQSDRTDAIGAGLSFVGASAENRMPANQFVAFRHVKSVTGTSYLEPIGVGLVVLDRTRLVTMMTETDLDREWQFYIVDSGNYVVASTEENIIGQRLDDAYFSVSGDRKDNGTPYYVRSSSVNKAGWKLVAAIPENRLYWEGEAFKYFIWIVVIILFALMIAFASYFNLIITNPIQKLTRAFAKAASGDLKTKVRFSSKNEITAVADAFNHMVSEIDTLTQDMVHTQRQLYETELEKKHLQITGLQNQINSHFLYNTLHCVRGMALSNSVEDLNQTIDHLVEYLRYGAHNEEYATLQEELNHVVSYMHIQNARFDHRFKLILDVSEPLLQQPILKLVLQPIVENAIFHGLDGIEKRGVIKLSARVENHTLVIHVLDNGKGMDPVSVRQLGSYLDHAENSSTTRSQSRRSIGLINIHKRLSIYYGSEYGMRIKSWERIGTSVRVVIPFTDEGRFHA